MFHIILLLLNYTYYMDLLNTTIGNMIKKTYDQEHDNSLTRLLGNYDIESLPFKKIIKRLSKHFLRNDD